MLQRFRILPLLILVAAAMLTLIVVTAGAYAAGKWSAPVAPTRVHRVRPLTDFPGMEEFPSISPDGRSVAFTASVGGRRQVFVRLLGRGSPVPITNDPVDHQSPRWSPDGN